MDKIAIDAMGGDFAPLEIVLGAIQAVREYKIPVVLVGDRERIIEILKENHEDSNPLIEIQHASQIIEMGEHPGMAYRKKKDASISVGARLVKEGKCGAVVAPGSTGAAVTAGLLGIGRIRGIERPAILTPIPNEKGGYTYLIDSGASAQPKLETYVQNALLGYVYAKKVAGINNPKIGLLNIGAESAKGSPLVAEAYQALSEQKIIPFAGNAEGRDVMTGDFDVVVTDGFTGNVVLKFGEGAGKLVSALLKNAIEKGGLRAKLGALLLKSALKKYMAKPLDYAEYGGAQLMGIKGVVVICHGASKAKAIKNAIFMARNVCREHIDEAIKETLEQMKIENAESVGNV